jgi:hypothetical protein
MKLFIIDEISMVGYKQFLQVDRRLDFEEDWSVWRYIICVGDFRQSETIMFFSEGKSVALHEPGYTPWENFRMFGLNEIMRDDVTLRTNWLMELWDVSVR